MIAESQVQMAETASGSAEATCVACAHPLEAHDQIGLRFCAATTASAIDRGCVCVGVANDPKHD